MSDKSFVIERTYNAPVEKVWNALTDKDQMKEWYFKLDEFRPEPGFEFSFAGQGHKGEKYIHLCKVLEVVKHKRLSYSWTYKDYPGYSVVTFELFSEGGNTRLVLTHAGLETFVQDNADFARESFAAGWTELIGKLLKQYVERA
jgi:uncharacterized protein YndB with AHSA1/START domain